ncbi:type II/IV secretion system ATPase subunit [Candidatus Nanohalobium constans]|uniref:Type IV secretory pathway ATPase VirB11/Archaellum biosynthesis ATPase n=1 Tax=Candidatus Nanohalobium constans TaxID=2565781 RepID=A0A5Q0UGP3_9ARCH|nr:type II/IV secretion system ATPase subunit [Candidatus Nanohalobium constans]QGA80823.1 Type IV secretory pathway ATPase VirB11/Archaellum biosynthesis ATPase [Candidatus Nanohalobium constans]
MAVRDKNVFDYEYEEETGTVRVNMLGSIYGASIEDYPEVMSRVINILQEVPGASSVILSESRDYEYGEEEISLLRGVANAIQEISSEGYLSQNIKTDNCDQLYSQHLPEVQQTVFDKMRRDPVGAYVELRRKKRHMQQSKEDSEYPQQSRCRKYFIQDVIQPVLDRMEQCEIIQRATNYITGHHVGDREVYREYFHPLVRPNFMLTKFMSLPPERGEEIDRYTVRNDIEVTTYRVPDKTRPVYHVDPPEFNLPEEKYNLLDAARRFMASHDPESGEFARPERMQNVFQNIGRDMLRDISNQMNIQLGQEELESLTDILNRYTSGLGVLELLLADPKIEDVYVNSPVGSSPIYVKHQDYGECETNLIPTKEEAESWATRFRIQSGRPLDEANPVLDTETEVTGGRARVAVIQENLSPEGLAFAFRRHRSKAWTLPLFIKNNMISPLAAGLLSFIVEGNRSVLFSGTRGAGKSSLLSASMLEIMKNHRIVTVEDTLEIPVPQMKDLGYNIERMKSRSVITQVENEMSADNAIRTSLRLGDSALVIGEVRSDEAQALYEAMRVGAVANFVGGTIHGEDAYSVFDRVVNDLDVPKTSFKATDIIVSVNKIKSPDGMETYRRVTGITEVRKEWTDDPVEENAFVDLMRYDSSKDRLVPTDTLINGESLILNRIAENIKEWKNDWDAVWNNIQLRKDIKQKLVEKAEEEDRDDLLEAEFVVKANQQFHILSEKVNEEYGEQQPERIMNRWEEWLDQQL